MKYIFKALIFLFTFIIITQNVLAVENSTIPRYMINKTFFDYAQITPPKTESGSISVYNTESGISIYEKNADVKVYPASTVKIMTAIIAYESIPDLSVPITVSRNVYNKSVGSKLGLKINDIYTAEDLLKAVLICGSNDAANQLSEYVTSGNDSVFIEKMNLKAKELGCKSTNFTNVTGLHDPEMYTTANDMMKIAEYAYRLGDIAAWSSLASYYFTPLNDPDTPKLKYNRNYFISRNVVSDYYYQNSLGLSAGSTPQAGNCLVTSASRNGCTYICVVMNSPSSENEREIHTYNDAEKILNKCFSSLEFQEVTDTSVIQGEVKLNLCADTNYLSLYPKESIKHLLPISSEYNKDITVEKVIYRSEADAPINVGEEFGELIVRYKNEYVLGKTKLICIDKYEKSTVLYIISEIREFVSGSFFIVTIISAVIMFVIYAILRIKLKNRTTMFNKRR